MGLMMSEGKFVGRDEIALVPTPEATASWKPVPHSDVIDAVTEWSRRTTGRYWKSSTVSPGTVSGCSA